MDLFGDLPPPTGKKRSASTGSDGPPAAAEATASATPTKRLKEDSSAPTTTPPIKISASAATTNAASAAAAAEEAPSPASSSSGGGRRWKVQLAQAHFGSKGRRQTMEDAHLTMSDEEMHELAPDLPSDLRLAMFGIFDGHGGRQVADFIKQEAPGCVAQELLARCALPAPKADSVVTALEHAVAALDERSQAQAREHQWADGCCAVMLVVVNDTAFVANMGDSKAVLCRRRRPDKPAKGVPLVNCDVGGEGSTGTHAKHTFPWSRTSAHEPPPPADALALTQDHKPIMASERLRIEAAGGRVEGGRVNGAIEVARSFGDVAFKRFGVVALADLRVRFKITQHEEFVLLGCDGIWSRYSEANACAFLRARMWAGKSWCVGKEHKWTLERAARSLVEDAVQAKGCQDNCSVMVVTFRHPDMNQLPAVGLADP